MQMKSDALLSKSNQTDFLLLALLFSLKIEKCVFYLMTGPLQSLKKYLIKIFLLFLFSSNEDLCINF